MADKNTNQQRRPANEALFALDEIHAKYRGIPSADIEKFTPVYYPIAMVEMYLDETTFEDFGVVQQAVLSLCNLGISNNAVIAQTLGLSPRYVEGILKVLYGAGLIDADGAPTQNGRESLHEQKQVRTVKVWQRFQVDALNGSLLRVEETINESNIQDRDQTSGLIGHLNYMDGIEARELIEQLTRARSEEYIRQPEGILNTNVCAIEDIRCDGVSYARCYMMKLMNQVDPIVFAKRYDPTKKTVRERFAWTPLFVPNETMRRSYGIEDRVPVQSRLCHDYVHDLYDMMVREEQKVDLLGKIDETLQRIYPFEEAGLDKSRAAASVMPGIKVTEQAFATYKPWILNFLIGIQHDGEYLVTNDRLYGLVIALEPEGEVLREAGRLAARLADRNDGNGRLELMRAMNDKFRDVQDPSLMERLIAYMEKLDK